jgi:pseudaminic acid cytidylyltransferase
MKVAIIPARGGSKRVPRKNIKGFHGRPMISYAIGAAQSSQLFDRIIVSTDDQEIADVARAYDAEVPFMRPSELADDHTATVPVIRHAISACERLGWPVEHVCCIYPAVPLLRSEDLISALELLLGATQAQFSFPVAEFPSAIQRSLRRSPLGLMSSFYKEYQHTRTQDLEPAYYDVGQFYWGFKNSWLETSEIHNTGVGLLVPRSRVVDIDTHEDWHIAETLFTIYGKPFE